MIKSNLLSQLYNDNLKLTDELIKRDKIIKILLSKLNNTRRKENGRK